MRTILIIEADHDTRVAIRQALEPEGYTVLSATNGKDALDALERARTLPSLIVLDLELPIMPGAHFLKEIQKNPGWAKIPVLQVTRKPQPALPGVCLAITKPFQLKDFLAAVNEHCLK